MLMAPWKLLILVFAVESARILGQDAKTALSARARVSTHADKEMHKTLVRKGEKDLSKKDKLYESGMRAKSNKDGGEISPSEPGPAWQEEAFKPGYYSKEYAHSSHMEKKEEMDESLFGKR